MFKNISFYWKYYGNFMSAVKHDVIFFASREKHQ